MFLIKKTTCIPKNKIASNLKTFDDTVTN